MADVGIRDVAAHAGVSVGTASAAINHPEQVSRRAASLVNNSIRALGYRPNSAARQLKTGRSFVLGLAIRDLGDPLTQQTMAGVEDTAEKIGYSILLGVSRDSAEREARYLELFERNRVDGVLFAPRSSTLDVLAPFQNRGVPVVLIGTPDTNGVIPSVTLSEDSLVSAAQTGQPGELAASYTMGQAAAELLLSLIGSGDTAQSRTSASLRTQP